MVSLKPLPLQLWHTFCPVPLQMGQTTPVPARLLDMDGSKVVVAAGSMVMPTGAVAGVSFLNSLFLPVLPQPRHDIFPVPEQEEQV
jgi:hypothetical protein